MAARIRSLYILPVIALMSVFATAYGDQVVRLEDLLDEARQSNPVLRAARERLEVYEARIPQAGALDDPRLSIEAVNIPTDRWALDRTPMSGVQLMLRQKFPFPGKLGLMEKAVRRSAEAAESEYLELVNDVLSQVKVAAYDLQFVLKNIEITTRNKGILEDFSRIAETKYSVGRGLQQDVLKAQVELSRALDRLLRLEGQKKTAEARLNTLLNRAPQQHVGSLEPFVHTSIDLDIESLQEKALRNKPLLERHRRKISSNEAVNSLARKGNLPDFDVGFGYRIRNDDLAGDPVHGSDFFSASLSMNLPIYFGRKQSKRVQETASAVSLSKSELEVATREVFFTISDLAAELQRREQQIELFETGILPQAEQSLESARSAYQVDKVDFLTLLDNQMTLFNLEIEHFRILTEYEKNVARLQLAVGTDEL